MPRCVNCSNDINFGGTVCPYCHMNPYDATSPGPYANVGPREEKGIDPMMVGLFGGMIVAAANPIAGVAVFGLGLVGRWFKNRG